MKFWPPPGPPPNANEFGFGVEGNFPSLPKSVNTIHPEPEIHEQIYMTKRLRNIVHVYKHILNNAERNVNNNVNDATHADKRTLQH